MILYRKIIKNVQGYGCKNKERKDWDPHEWITKSKKCQNIPGGGGV
jgi:hypothetical protein